MLLITFFFLSQFCGNFQVRLLTQDIFFCFSIYGMCLLTFKQMLKLLTISQTPVQKFKSWNVNFFFSVYCHFKWTEEVYSLLLLFLGEALKA